jgi:hypothetical protein
MILPVGLQNKPLRFFKDITICVYCGFEQRCNSFGCCGESSTHFEEVWVETDEKGKIINDETFSTLYVGMVYSGYDKLKELGAKC